MRFHGILEQLLQHECMYAADRQCCRIERAQSEAHEFLHASLATRERTCQALASLREIFLSAASHSKNSRHAAITSEGLIDLAHLSEPSSVKHDKNSSGS